MTETDLPGLDLAALTGYVDRELPGLRAGTLSAQVIEGGRSNLTYLVTDGTARWIVRRPPLGHVLPTAHDMAREYRVISALAPTDLPVPATLALCTDPEVLGAPFYVMDYVSGIPYRRKEDVAALGEDRIRAIAFSLVDTLVDLHAVDPEAVGLGDFGRPAGFLERQLRRWKRQLDASRSRDLPGVDELHDKLAAALPASGAPAIVHGDYRMDNVLVTGDDRIAAVLDWEMSTVGDPLTDLALMIVYAEREAPDNGVIANPSAAPGYPASDEIIARYTERSGRDTSALSWYVAFGFFKLAVISEGIYYRFQHGQTVGSGFESVGELAGSLIAHGAATLKED